METNWDVYIKFTPGHSLAIGIYYTLYKVTANSALEAINQALLHLSEVENEGLPIGVNAYPEEWKVGCSLCKVPAYQIDKVFSQRTLSN